MPPAGDGANNDVSLWASDDLRDMLGEIDDMLLISAIIGVPFKLARILRKKLLRSDNTL